MGGSDIKTEPVLIEGKQVRNPCTRCEFEFSRNHLARMCKRPRVAISRGAGRNGKRENMMRAKLIEQ